MRKLNDEQIERVLYAAETKGIDWHNPYDCVAYHALGRPPRGHRRFRWAGVPWVGETLLGRLVDRRWHQISEATRRVTYVGKVVRNREEARTWLILSGLA